MQGYFSLIMSLAMILYNLNCLSSFHVFVRPLETVWWITAIQINGWNFGSIMLKKNINVYIIVLWLNQFIINLFMTSEHLLTVSFIIFWLPYLWMFLFFFTSNFFIFNVKFHAWYTFMLYIIFIFYSYYFFLSFYS